MRSLTKKELVDFFKWAREAGPGPNHMEQSKLAAEVATDLGILEAMARRAQEGLKLGVSPTGALLSLLVAFFQLGRECESKLRECRPRSKA